jgi:hypothetical protein
MVLMAPVMMVYSSVVRGWETLVVCVVGVMMGGSQGSCFCCERV